jgi:DNA-binding LytR/AlgR family response regulator
VARDAVIDCARGRGRAMLTLRNGLRVPVSRTFAPALRRLGWF